MKLITSNEIKKKKIRQTINAINKKEALIRLSQLVRHNLISFVLENFILEKLISQNV